MLFFRHRIWSGSETVHPATPEMKDRYLGMVQTIWSGAGQFLDNYYGRKPENPENSQTVNLLQKHKTSQPQTQPPPKGTNSALMIY